MSEERREGEGPKVVVGLTLNPKDRHSTLIAGLLIIAFGVLLLLDQEGIVPVTHVLRFWPLILIVPGLVKLFQGRTTEERVFGTALVFFGLLFLFSALGFRHFDTRQHGLPGDGERGREAVLSSVVGDCGAGRGGE